MTKENRLAILRQDIPEVGLLGDETYVQLTVHSCIDPPYHPGMVRGSITEIERELYRRSHLLFHGEPITADIKKVCPKFWVEVEPTNIRCPKFP